MSLATKLKAENDRLSHTEMTWFSRSAYNLVIERYKTWPHTALLSLTKSCIGFTSMTDKAHTDELLVYRCLCLYLRSVLSISIGREIEDTKTHHYAEAQPDLSSTQSCAIANSTKYARRQVSDAANL